MDHAAGFSEHSTTGIEALLNQAVGLSDNQQDGRFSKNTLENLVKLLKSYPNTSSDGCVLRIIAIENGIVDRLLNDLAALTHQTDSISSSQVAKQVPGVTNNVYKRSYEEAFHHPKGIGYANASARYSKTNCNLKEVFSKKQEEEDLIILIFKVLTSYLSPQPNQDILLEKFKDLLIDSDFLSIVLMFLRNDSILDISRHFLLYQALIKLLKSIGQSKELVKIFLLATDATENLIISLLGKMMIHVETYLINLDRIKIKKVNDRAVNMPVRNLNCGDAGDNEDLICLLPEIKETQEAIENEIIWMMDFSSTDSSNSKIKSISEKYVDHMQKFQRFGSFEIISEQKNKFLNVMFHYEKDLKTDQNIHPAKQKRLAQESATLSTSLPLTYSSSIFVRCDTNRLDVMKVLITGPEGTPYANGCFIFDIYFPPLYPNEPMKVNLETTGRGSVRFNPNLYNSGKVCLSIINTWEGSPEERWNPQTSNLLQVLVSIQSLILVPDPYFNEPGYQCQLRTPHGKGLSHKYNMNLLNSTLQWAILDQLKNPSPVFKEIIQSHFYIKANAILAQAETWIAEMESSSSKHSSTAASSNFKELFDSLSAELSKLPEPKGLK